MTENTWVIDSSFNATQMIDTPNGVASYGENEAGELFLATLSGSIYAVRETSYPEVLTLTAADSPLDGVYQAADSIIIENNATIDPNADITFICPNLTISQDVEVPIMASLKINRGVCNE